MGNCKKKPVVNPTSKYKLNRIFFVIVAKLKRGWKITSLSPEFFRPMINSEKKESKKTKIVNIYARSKEMKYSVPAKKPIAKNKNLELKPFFINIHKRIRVNQTLTSLIVETTKLTL